MSLLMEALKKAEQSKQSTSTSSEVIQDTPTQEKVVASLGAAKMQADGSMEEQSADISETTHDIAIETAEPLPDTNMDEATLLEDKLAQIEAETAPEVIEPLDIEDPNSGFDNLDELEWHFDLEDEIVEPEEKTDDSEVVEESTAFDLEAVEQIPEKPETSLLEKAELAPEQQDSAAILLDDEQEILEQAEKPLEVNDSKTVQVSNDNDELEWDADLFTPEQSRYAPNPMVQPEESQQTFSPTSTEPSFNLDEKPLQKAETTPPKPELKSDITQPDPLTAKRVLLATAPTHHRKTYKASLLAILFIAFILGAGFAGYYVYQLSLMQEFPLLADFKAEQPQSTITPTVLPKSTEPPLVTPAVIESFTNKDEAEPKAQTFMEKAKSLLTEVISDKPAPVNQPKKEPVIEYQPTLDEMIAQAVPVKPAAAARPQQPIMTKSIMASLDENQPRVLPQQQAQKDIQIKKVSRSTQQIHNQLTRAYQAFQKGQNQRAKRLYQQILNKHSKNRDALLGLAAIAQRSDQTQAAEYYYQQILKYYPDDSLAQMGLNAVQQASPQSSESQIKMLLDQSPQSAYLHFSLGNVYAQQKRWREAQQAYFDAHRFDEQKADYAYNLAVSLEYLHQSKAALDRKSVV